MKHTPYTITKNNLFYTIPIYQRLFEWDDDNIMTLLDDLKKEYNQTNGENDYYIGMLTSTKDNELVDGQQRFTVLMLLGCVLQDYYKEWESFLIGGDKTRIDFSSRPLDNMYLRSLIAHRDTDGMTFINFKMHNGCKLIRKFIEGLPSADQIPFAAYVYNHISFFISDLPAGYSPKDLNKYFERMNTTGKNLEQHEILKVKLLSNLDSDIDKYMLLWNKLSDVDTLLIKGGKNENKEDIKRRALCSSISTIFTDNLVNGINGITDDSISKSISDIEPTTVAPKNEREVNKGSRCAISFPYLLLQVLYRKLNKKINCHINDFFKPSNLLSTFEEYLPFSGNNVNKNDIQEFMEMLVKARLALDICFVRPTEYGYSLDMTLDEDTEDLKKLMMLESMLYVSSSNYTNHRWFNWLMDQVENGIPNVNDMYKSLKSFINNTFALPTYEALNYTGDNRFWFWLLDFYIWENRSTLFDKGSKEMSVAENYIFKRNRSIEHIAPQTPQSDSRMKWNDTPSDHTLRDSFGNLVMISQGLNSTLSNESYEIKTAHVQSYYNGSKSGSIESLKLLLVYKDYPNGWTKESINEHGQKMYEFLKSCYAKLAL